MNDLMYGQFTLSRGHVETPPGFCVHRCHGWQLHAHPALPVHEILDPDGARLGFLLGYVIREGELRFRSSSLSFPHARDLDAGYLEAAVAGMQGRFLLVILSNHSGGGMAVAYPDPFSSLSSVYSPTRRILSSTSSLLCYREGCRHAYPVDVFPAGKANRFYPGDLTDVEDCFRLLPNHRLDLQAWEASRFWPRDALEPDEETKADRHVETIVKSLRSNLVATHATGLPLYAPLTAGRDSRVILACTPARVREDTTFVTLRFKSDRYRHAKDLHIGRRLGRRHRLNHQVVRVQAASKEDLERYFYTIGRAGGSGKAGKYYRTPLEKLDMNAAWQTGFGGAIAIRHYARDTDDAGRPTAVEILRRLRLPERTDFLAATEGWLQRLPPGASTGLLIDLLYMEMRLGSWACPHLYGTAPFRVSITPFSDRRFVEACFALPYAYRRLRRSQVRIIEMADPRLLDIPFEQLTGAAKYWRMLTHR